ncbi:hypothetical protein V8F33_006639 [Rhypophila sp. PSN 637]
MEPPNDLESQLLLFTDILAWKPEEQEFAGTLAAIENVGFTTSVQDLVKPSVEILDRRVGECILATNHLLIEDAHHEGLLGNIQQAIQLMEAQQALVQEHRSKIRNAMTAVANQQSLLVAQRTRLFADETDVETIMRPADERVPTRHHIARRNWIKQKKQERHAKRLLKKLKNAEQDGPANEPEINNEEQYDVHMHGCASHDGIALANSLKILHEDLLVILSKYIDADPIRMHVVEQWLPTWNKLEKRHWASWQEFENASGYFHRSPVAYTRMKITYQYEFAARQEMGAFEAGNELPTFTLDDYQAALQLQHQRLAAPTVTGKRIWPSLVACKSEYERGPDELDYGDP